MEREEVMSSGVWRREKWVIIDKSGMVDRGAMEWGGGGRLYGRKGCLPDYPACFAFVTACLCLVGHSKKKCIPWTK